MGPVPGDDGRARCPWGAAPGSLRDYHDTEWGVALRGETAFFERLSLEAFQSGLSWATILAKRPAFRAAFAGFDAEVVAGFGDADRARLMADAGIVRNARKVEATIGNARAVVALRQQGGLEALIRAHAPTDPPAPVDTDTMATTSTESVALSKALKRHGFGFVGPTTMYALMEAAGIFDPHLVGCFRRVRS